VVAASGQAGVTTQVLQQLLRRGESLAAVGLAGDPTADVRPAAGRQRGRIRQRGGRHRAEGGQGHGQPVLLMIALGAAARTTARAHHDLSAVHAVLATGAVRILADRHQSLAAGWCLDAGVAQVGVAAGRIRRRVAEERRRRGLMMREGRRAGKRWPEGRVLGQAGWTAERIARESWKTTGFVGRQAGGVLGSVRTREDLHSGSDDWTGAIVIVVIVAIAAAVVVVVVVVVAPR